MFVAPSRISTFTENDHRPTSRAVRGLVLGRVLKLLEVVLIRHVIDVHFDLVREVLTGLRAGPPLACMALIVVIARQ